MDTPTTSTPRAEALLSRVHDEQPELFQEIIESGGLRTLFDRMSVEWNNTSMEDKLDILDKLHLSGFQLHEVAIASSEIMVAHGYPKQEAVATVMVTYATLLEGALDDRAA